MSVRWGGANLARIDWGLLKVEGSEYRARHQTPAQDEWLGQESSFGGYARAVRANRQLAHVLHDQGLTEEANYFAYRAQCLQRRVLWRQRKLLKVLGSWLLWLIAGYGYRPLRTLLIYLCAIVGFAAGYFAVTQTLPTQTSPLAWYEALVLSVSSFHGRGFFQPVQSLGDPVAILATIEAVFGLLIEISFIATFTKRFFGR